jgi:hypothetical protein
VVGQGAREILIVEDYRHRNGNCSIRTRCRRSYRATAD